MIFLTDVGIAQPRELTNLETLTLNKAARFMIATHLGASKLRTYLTASTSTGLTDSDTRVFKFRR